MRAHDRSDGLAPKQSLMISPLGPLEGFSFECIVLVKLPSEAVGSEREDSRAAAHLIWFLGCRLRYSSAGVR